MKKILLIIFCLSIINLAFSQNENDDAEYLKIVKEYTLNVDGSIDYNYSKSIKLLSYFSFHRLYGETFIIYNTDFQNMKVNSAFTIMADGKKVVTPKNAFNEVLPRFSTNAPVFNNIREMVVTHTGLEVGSIINLDYTISSKAGYFPYLQGDETLSESSPVNELIIKINIPEKQTLNFELLNIDGVPVIKSKNSMVTYTWKFNSIAANSKDSYQEHNHVTEPRLLFSTATDMKSAYKQFISQKAFHYTTNKSMDKVVLGFVEDETDQLKIALNIQKIISNNINNLNIPLEYTGTKCRTAIQTWNSNQGTQLEKAILFSALLNKASITADPVAIIPNMYFNKEIGNFSMYNHYLVRIELKNHGEIYLATNYTNKQNLKFDLDGQTGLLLKQNDDNPRIISFKSSVNNIIFSGEFDLLDPNKLLGNLSIELTNGSLPYYSLYKDSSYIKSIVKGGISASDMVSSKIEKLTPKKAEASISIEKEKATTNQGRYYTFELPSASNGVDSWHMTLLNERKVPLEIPKLVSERYEYAIVIPEGSKLVTPPTFSFVKYDIGSVTLRLEQVENKIVIIKEIKFEKKIISPGEYPNLKKLMDIWNNSNYRKVIFKVNGKIGAVDRMKPE